jgi:hypothetical protein
LAREKLMLDVVERKVIGIQTHLSNPFEESVKRKKTNLFKIKLISC